MCNATTTPSPEREPTDVALPATASLQELEGAAAKQRASLRREEEDDAYNLACTD